MSKLLSALKRIENRAADATPAPPHIDAAMFAPRDVPAFVENQGEEAHVEESVSEETDSTVWPEPADEEIVPAPSWYDAWLPAVETGDIDPPDFQFSEEPTYAYDVVVNDVVEDESVVAEKELVEEILVDAGPWPVPAPKFFVDDAEPSPALVEAVPVESPVALAPLEPAAVEVAPAEEVVAESDEAAEPAEVETVARMMGSLPQLFSTGKMAEVSETTSYSIDEEPVAAAQSTDLEALQGNDVDQPADVASDTAADIDGEDSPTVRIADFVRTIDAPKAAPLDYEMSARDLLPVSIPFVPPVQRPYRQICENILARLPAAGRAVLALTWVDEDLDHTPLVVRLAEVLADRLDDPVLVVDAGAERRLARLLRATAEAPVTAALSDDAAWRDLIVQTDTPGLCVLGGRPNELEADPVATARLLESCRGEFGLVIVTGGPASGLSESLLAACDGSLLLVEAQHTPSTAAVTAANRLSAAGAELLGCVLTGVETGDSPR